MPSEASLPKWVKLMASPTMLLRVPGWELGALLGRLALMVLLLLLSGVGAMAQTPSKQPILAMGEPHIKVDGLSFRDLNRDGKLEPYEDWRLDPSVRAHDLVSRMTLGEKAGAMMHASAPAIGSIATGRGTTYELNTAGELIDMKHVSTFITRLSGTATSLATRADSIGYSSNDQHRSQEQFQLNRGSECGRWFFLSMARHDGDGGTG